MTRHLFPSMLAGAVALGCAATSGSTGTSTSGSQASAPKPVHRISYKPEVLFSSFGEVDFDRDAAVVQRYLGRLQNLQHPCNSGERTAREKLDGVRAKRDCPPPDPAESSPAPVTVLVDSIPEGIDISNGKIQVANGKGLALVGRMKWEVPRGAIGMSSSIELTAGGNYAYAFRRPKAEIVDALKYLARAASANLVLVTFIDEKADTAQGAAGLLFYVDLSALDTSKNRLGKVPTEI